MSIQRVNRDEMALLTAGVLGLDESAVDLFSTEAICASLRRAASFLCPASPRQIVDSVLDVLMPLIPGLKRHEVNETLDVLVSAGDLLELRPSGGRARLLFLGPPSYVEKQQGHFLLVGIRPNAGPIVDEERLGRAVTYESHTRSVVLDPGEAREVLAAAGLHRLTREQWTKAPRHDKAATVVKEARERLAASQTPGQISGLTLIDAAAPVRYYKGRWREPALTDQGLFVGRRPQAYGAAVWCAVELGDGVPQAVLDLPVDSTVAPGWDEARRLQAALDAERGSAQVFRVRPTGQPDGGYIFDFFGPLPSWAERYLDLTGLPVAKSQGSLFSYRVSDGAQGNVREFLFNSLWMQIAEEVQET
ncbi:hypothetical protein LWF01_05530 [Saxibacter everestensis]|uniref:Uncharacterized protein n=1 Tax=Saxibacter everestensis TaxID=2909229 RepID=A0ABY8QW68_9MICO|nr:hypothetical protein LWF01_05530 [Brevibacteriaceae bacterium ZFBP1038]